MKEITVFTSLLWILNLSLKPVADYIWTIYIYINRERENIKYIYIYIYIYLNDEYGEGREVRKKSAFETSFGLLTVFKGILCFVNMIKFTKWSKCNVSFLCSHDMIEVFHCQTATISNPHSCSWQEFKHYLILGLAPEVFMVF